MKVCAKARIIAVGSVLLSLALMSCQGRTMKNMEPTGETVEVVVSTSPDAVEDTLALEAQGPTPN